VVIVNEAFAREFGLDPRRAVGKLMGRGVGDVELDLQIVGVVEDARYSTVRDEVPAQFFLPHRQNATLGFLTFYVRTAGEPTSVLRAIPDVMKRLDPTLPVEELKTLDQQVRENIFLDRLTSLMAAAFAALATLLAAIGLYGVLSYTVAQRTREIGLRMALGAPAPTIGLMVLRQVGWMLALGGAIGVAAAFAIGRAAGSILYEVQGSDPLTFAAAILLLGLVALVAGFIPAARAARTDPMQALRYE
jgi:ABC-type antimicrobial peptide transport system permease subunit